MKLLKQVVSLAVCGLITVCGVVAMEEAQGGVVGETEVVASEKQPVDGAAEASVPVGVLREEQRAFLRAEIVNMYRIDPCTRCTKYDVCSYRESIEKYNDAELFLKYMGSRLRLTAHVLYSLRTTRVSRISDVSRGIRDCLSAMIQTLRATGDKLRDKKLTLEPDVDLFSFFTSVSSLVNDLHVCFYFCQKNDLAPLVTELKNTLLAQVTAVFAEGEALREITDTIKRSFILEAIQKERCDEE